MGAFIATHQDRHRLLPEMRGRWVGDKDGENPGSIILNNFVKGITNGSCRSHKGKKKH
jgi:hypothetical protein